MWPESLAGSTWSPPGFAADLRCFSLFSNASSPGLHLEVTITERLQKVFRLQWTQKRVVSKQLPTWKVLDWRLAGLVVGNVSTSSPWAALNVHNPLTLRLWPGKIVFNMLKTLAFIKMPGQRNKSWLPVKSSVVYIWWPRSKLKPAEPQMPV